MWKVEPSTKHLESADLHLMIDPGAWAEGLLQPDCTGLM
jgi:hypothetical protein